MGEHATVAVSDSERRTDSVPSTVTLTLPDHFARKLFGHLFPGDNDEHGAVIHAGVARTNDGRLRLLARDVVLARDGVEYVPGRRGYRMLTGEFVTEQILLCRERGCVYLAVHNHGGTDRVEFSSDDLASQARGYPALLDILNGSPVGALVFARRAAAGRLWLTPTSQMEIDEVRILGTGIKRLRSAPASARSASQVSATYDRQARLFGDRGQELLASLKVGVIGAGGAGSLITEYLARLGVGTLIVIDPERIDPTNVPRITGSTQWDAMSWLRDTHRPSWMQRIGERVAAPKVRIMRRLARRANRRCRVIPLMADFVDDEVARSVLECDYLFLAADTMHARLVFNAIVHSYLIPGVQVGAKVPIDSDSGAVESVFTVTRPVSPSSGCLWCNGVITARGLQRESESVQQRQAQRYVDEPEIPAPSVITLNATAASLATNDFLFAVTDLVGDDTHTDYVRVLPRERGVKFEHPRRDPSCLHCGVGEESLFARGDAASLPTRLGTSAAR